MTNEFTAVVERDGEWFIAYCAEIPGPNGQGRTKDEALESLKSAVALVLEDRREDALRGLPADAVQEKVTVGSSAAISSAICGGMAATSSGRAEVTPSGAIRGRVP